MANQGDALEQAKKKEGMNDEEKKKFNKMRKRIKKQHLAQQKMVDEQMKKEAELL